MKELNIELHQGDCMDVMAGLPDNSVDMILTDPPYGIKYQSHGRTKSPKFEVLKNDDNDMRFVAYKEMYRILADDSVLVTFASWKNYHKDYAELEKYFDIKNVIVWWKHGGGMGDLKHTLATDYELAIVCHKGKCKLRGKREGSVWECGKVAPSKMVHATQKPVKLMRDLILKYTDEGDTVLDGFMGSGSTGVACVETGRNFVGIELDEKYYGISAERINEAQTATEGE